MPPSLEGIAVLPAPQPRSTLLIAALLAVGVGFTLYVFYPGVMTYDARYIYEDIAKATLGDWQSPVMTMLWSTIDPVAPGSGSMFLLMATLYWATFGLLALTIARASFWLAALLLVLAMSPPAFSYVGIIWRDVLFAAVWLLAATLTLATAQCRALARAPSLVAALTLLALGFLIRPNALPAAPLLAAYILAPREFLWKRALILYAPIGLTLFVLLQFVYYGVLHATPQHAVQSIMVFDLGGISHFSGDNAFPGAWSDQEHALITSGCYRPTEWDIYWTEEPCRFVMERLEGEKLFGTPALVHTWIGAIAAHPAAYIEHRLAFMWNFLAGSNLTLWITDISDPAKTALADRTGFAVVRAVDAVLKPTPISRPGIWLLACLAVCGFAWRRRATPWGAFAIGICGAAAAYVLSFLVVGVASDFRYAYPAVLAAIAGGIATAVPLRAENVSAGEPPR
jgi:hypothetical protein